MLDGKAGEKKFGMTDRMPRLTLYQVHTSTQSNVATTRSEESGIGALASLFCCLVRAARQEKAMDEH